MIPRAPGYNLSSRREPVRATTGRAMTFPVRPEKPGKTSSPCLSRLCEDIGAIAIQGVFARPIAELCMDSRRASPGSLFFALPGEQTDGSFYVEEAIDRGAVAVVTEKSGRHHPRATFVQVTDARAAMAVVARRFFNFSPAGLDLIGVTGSHGKTCVTHLLKHLLHEADARSGLFSSICYDLGSRIVPSFRATPEPVDLYGMLAQIEENGCRRAVLEIGFHGIERKRVQGLPLDVAVFLNLGDEHADGPGGQDECFLAKSRLFTGASGPLPRVAVVNLDDPWGRRLIQLIPPSVRVVSFGRSRYADIRAAEVVEGDAGAIMTIVWPEGSAKVRTREVGGFAVSNILAAVAAGYAAGVELNAVLPWILSFAGVPGRMEQVDEGQGFRLIVDSARSPESARHALRAAREICDGRLLVVFGCRGQEDRSRRPLFVQAIQDESDFSWGTADNPRNEPLGNIFRDMRRGVSDPESIVFVNDRRRAIALAVDTAKAGDVVVLLGKGHETFQYVGDSALPFDDRVVARELLALREVALTV